MAVICQKCGSPNSDKIRYCKNCGSKVLKVYGISTHHTMRIGQWRYVAAVSSLKEFAQLLDVSLYYARNHASRTGNPKEEMQALAKPHTLIPIEPRDYSAIQAWKDREKTK